MQVGPSRKRLTRILLWAAPLTWLGCGGGGGTDIVLPSLTITTSTGGVELDSDGYGVAVDGSSPQAIGPDATVTVDQLPDGQHTVELSGVAANCSAANNPRTVTVSSGGTATAAFAITCGPSSAGSVAVTTTTSGAGSDPDGFALTVDGVDRGAIGVNATITLASLTQGGHLVGLTGLAANCVVAGDNPRSVTVTSDQATPVGFTINCEAPPPGSGSVQITTTTTGSSLDLDPDGYTVSLDGGNPQGIGTTGILTIANVPAGSRSVQLSGEAPNCTVSGSKTRAVIISSGQTATVQFTITCAPTTGGLTLTTSGLPAGTAAAITVGGPNGFSRVVTETETLTGLLPGSYSVSAATVVSAGTSYSATVDRPSVSISAGVTASVTITYRAAVSLNLSIAGMYLTQSTQTLDGTVPLVANRPGFLRVFAVASGVNTARPSVRVRFFVNGTLTRTQTISPTAQSTPTQVQEGTLGSSWNLPVDASLIQLGLSIVADVDPDSKISETNEADNTFPASGTPQAITVQSVSLARIRFVPVLQTTNGLEGTVGNAAVLLDMARRIYPLQTVQSDVHAVFSVSGPLQPTDANGQWSQALTDLEGQRVTESSDWTYFGMVRLDYVSGQNGTAFVGNTTPQSTRAALGSDQSATVAEVVAHELGHTWGQGHAPCGVLNPATVDPNYPYLAGQIGVYGLDVSRVVLKPREFHDIMSYCSDRWISDYTYQRVLAFRAVQPPAAFAPALAQSQPSLLVWGHIVNGQPVLEPSFRIVARPSVPTATGPYSVQGLATDGTSLFKLSFDVAEVADDPGGSRPFAFAVPLDQARAARLGSLRVVAPGGVSSAASLSVAQLRNAATPDSVVARREAGGVMLEWNAAAYPMIMVRDPDTGEVLSFARGGKARVWTTKRSLDLVASDGVQSKAKRVTVTR
jgi:hypothetical protein